MNRDAYAWPFETLATRAGEEAAIGLYRPVRPGLGRVHLTVQGSLPFAGTIELQHDEADRLAAMLTAAATALRREATNPGTDPDAA